MTCAFVEQLIPLSPHLVLLQKVAVTMRRTVKGKKGASSAGGSAAVWYGPDRPKFLGPFSEEATPPYLNGAHLVVVVMPYMCWALRLLVRDIPSQTCCYPEFCIARSGGLCPQVSMCLRHAS